MSNLRTLFTGHVEIDGGTVKSSDRYEPGTRIYFVDAVYPDGCRLGVWDGADYFDAIEAAKEWDLPIHDKIIGGVQ